MSLEERINADIKAAMLAKEAGKLDALRAVKATILMLKTSGATVSGEDEIKALQKMVKQRKETAELYRTQKRDDLAQPEEEQAAIIEAYLPTQMSEEEIKAAVSKIISDTGAASMADMGKVMGLASKALAGKADGKTLSNLVKQLLS